MQLHSVGGKSLEKLVDIYVFLNSEYTVSRCGYRVNVCEDLRSIKKIFATTYVQISDTYSCWFVIANNGPKTHPSNFHAWFSGSGSVQIVRLRVRLHRHNPRGLPNVLCHGSCASTSLGQRNGGPNGAA